MIIFYFFLKGITEYTKLQYYFFNNVASSLISKLWIIGVARCGGKWDIFSQQCAYQLGVKMAAIVSCTEAEAGASGATMHLLGDFVKSFTLKDTCDETEKFPSFREPREIGQFSLVGPNREYTDGCSGLKFLHMPSHRHRLMWDLNRGYEIAIRKEADEGEKLDNLLRWITQNKVKFAVNVAAGEPETQRQAK